MSDVSDYREKAYDMRDEVFDYYIGVLDEYANGDNHEYWQGRKDAVRAVLIIINSFLGEFGNIRALKTIMETSPDMRLSKIEAMQHMLASAVPFVALAIQKDAEGKLMPATLSDGLSKFILQYDEMASNGICPKINHVLSEAP